MNILHKPFWAIISLCLLCMSCSLFEEDTRLKLSDPIFPSEQPDALNGALIIVGEQHIGKMPASVNSNSINITVSVSSALITNDNFLFLPFAFDVESNLKGIYLQVVGANSFWDVPASLLDLNANSYAIAIGIPPFVQKGNFQVAYKIYDHNNNISAEKLIDVAVVDSENRCGSGQGFPRVEGSDGITVRTYDMGDVAGTVEISYYMYTLKDRMDIRYNGQWVASTSPVLLGEGEAPPFKTCDEASPSEGFISYGGTFSIPYDPKISREISIYVSGCLLGGTQWFFDVKCPNNSSVGGGNAICGKSSAQAIYDRSNENYHFYPQEGNDLTTVICDPATDPGCSTSAVFQAMISQANFIAPTDDTSPVTDCKLTWVNYLPGENPVVSTINYFENSVTNYTLSDQLDLKGQRSTHFLHPGKVTRQIVLEHGKVVVKTQGEGTGPWKELNQSSWTTGFIWKKTVDSDLKKYWNQN